MTITFHSQISSELTWGKERVPSPPSPLIVKVIKRARVNEYYCPEIGASAGANLSRASAPRYPIPTLFPASSGADRGILSDLRVAEEGPGGPRAIAAQRPLDPLGPCTLI